MLRICLVHAKAHLSFRLWSESLNVGARFLLRRNDKWKMRSCHLPPALWRVPSPSESALKCCNINEISQKMALLAQCVPSTSSGTGSHSGYLFNKLNNSRTTSGFAIIAKQNTPKGKSRTPPPAPTPSPSGNCII